jgi:hypothetical protein
MKKALLALAALAVAMTSCAVAALPVSGEPPGVVGSTANVNAGSSFSSVKNISPVMLADGGVEKLQPAAALASTGVSGGSGNDMTARCAVGQGLLAAKGSIPTLWVTGAKDHHIVISS